MLQATLNCRQPFTHFLYLIVLHVMSLCKCFNLDISIRPHLLLVDCHQHTNSLIDHFNSCHFVLISNQSPNSLSSHILNPCCFQIHFHMKCQLTFSFSPLLQSVIPSVFYYRLKNIPISQLSQVPRVLSSIHRALAGTMRTAYTDYWIVYRICHPHRLFIASVY